MAILKESLLSYLTIFLYRVKAPYLRPTQTAKPYKDFYWIFPFEQDSPGILSSKDMKALVTPYANTMSYQKPVYDNDLMSSIWVKRSSRFASRGNPFSALLLVEI